MLKKIFQVTKWIVIAIVLAIGFLLAPLFIGRSSSDDCDKLHKIKKELLFTTTKECRSRAFGGWQDAPHFTKIRGNSSLCEEFVKIPKTNTTKLPPDNRSAVSGYNFVPSEFSEMRCEQFSIPPNYRCFVLRAYPYRYLFGFKEDCSESVVYIAGGLRLDYVGKKDPLF
jgi:hypothetical protein